MARMKKQPEYITIPRASLEGERDLSRINRFVEDQSRRQRAAVQKLTPLASSQLGQTAPSLVSLVDVRMAGVCRALVLDMGSAAEAVVSACQAAGVTPVVAYVGDAASAPHLALTDTKVCIGATKAAFQDNYCLLAAAEIAQAPVILVADSALAEDTRFLRMAADLQLQVYRLDLDAFAASSFGGTTKAWGLATRQGHEPLPASPDTWTVCTRCGKVVDASRVRANHKVCPHCGHHFRMTSQERIRDMVDAGSFQEWQWDVPQTDPLNFPGYRGKLEQTQARTGLTEGVRCGSARIAGMPFALCIMDSTFLMGSMGSVVGERIARAAECATQERLPLVIFCASGGARMQEGLVSLMQMAKISAAIQRHQDSGLLYVSVITDPTTGGVTASFATQGQVILAEPRALIGFAGRRVIQDTIRQELPEEFQTAEFALEHGLIDAIVERPRMRETLASVLAVFADRRDPLGGSIFDEPVFVPAGKEQIARALEEHPTEWQHEDRLEEGPRYVDGAEYAFGSAIAPRPRISLPEGEGLLSSVAKLFKRPGRLERQALEESGKRVAQLLSAPVRSVRPDGQEVQPDADNPAWNSVKAARDTHRPTSAHYLEAMVDGFLELHGDRSFADDAAIVAGVGWIGQRPVLVLAQEKGRNLQERIQRNFGCPQPEGYRKSLRLMRLAEAFGLPVVCLVDTQGAFCGKEAEERGQGNAIAENLLALAGLRVPVVSVLVGEGGSGGALALALSDRVAMQEHAVYSVLSPEGFASILWKDRSRAPEAAAVMRMNAYEIYDMGVVDTVLEEGEGSASQNPDFAAQVVRRYVARTLKELADVPIERLLDQRYERFRKF